MLKRCIEVVGKEHIGLVIGDREFVGHKWMRYLKDNGLLFLMRLPKHHSIERFNGEVVKVDQLVFEPHQPLLLKDCLVDGVWGQVWVKPLENGDYLFLFGTVKVELMGQLYRKRWTIEAGFQTFKERGFDLEKTHLKDFSKLKKLLALVGIAYSIATSMGIYMHRKVHKINTKNHGYKANSFAVRALIRFAKCFEPNKSYPRG